MATNTVPFQKGMSLFEFNQPFDNEAQCEAALERERWPDEPIPDIGRWLGRVVEGHMNYYSVPGNHELIGPFAREAVRAWRFSLCPRSQRNRMPLEPLCSDRATLHASTTCGSSIPSQAISRQDC